MIVRDMSILTKYKGTFYLSIYQLPYVGSTLSLFVYYIHINVYGFSF